MDIATRPVTLCIINFNGAEHLRRAFAALDEQDWRFGEILVVDNASEDESLAVVNSLCPSARVIRLPDNRGPGAARNAGAEAARHDLILFQDNDIRLQVGTVSSLVAGLANNGPATAGAVLAVAPRVLYADAPTVIQFESADCHFLGLMATRNADTLVSSVRIDAMAGQPVETSSLVTACFLFDRSHWSEGALFDESFGFNLEDHDFGVRACVAGLSLRVTQAASVLHGSGTPGLSFRPGGIASQRRLYYLVRNRWAIIAKCYAARTLIVLTPVLLLYEALQCAWLVRSGHGRVWWRAVRDLAARRRGLRAARRRVQARRRVPDVEILRDGPLPLTPQVREDLGGRILSLFDKVMRIYWRAARVWL